MNAKYLFILAPICLSGCFATGQALAPAQRTPTSEAAPTAIDAVGLKRASDIDHRLKLVKGAGIEASAQAIADVDEWLYVPDEEKQARDRIEVEIEILRSQIEAEIANLSKAALNAPAGRDATEKLLKINPLFALYPAPKTEAQRVKVAQMSSSILSVSRRVEEVQRLRYNTWAVSQVQSGLEGYRSELKVKGMADISKLLKTNKEALITVCINAVGTIDPAFLEPAVMDLYNYFHGLVRDALGNDDENRVKLAKGLVNPNIQRRNPSEF